MHTKIGVVVALILVASMASARETESELLSRMWSINMTHCKAWPLYWTGNGVCLLTGKGEAMERPLKHLSGADVAYLRTINRVE
jgi:hypothetical protein